MSDSFDLGGQFVPTTDTGGVFDERDPTERQKKRIDGLTISASAFANAMAKAFTQATTGGKQFDDVLKTLALRMSALTVAAAFKPVAKGLGKGLADLIGSLFGIDPQKSGKKDDTTNPGGIILNATDGIQPFAAGGVIGTPTYFPLSSGGLGLAGEVGPEAIVPLARGADGRLGVSMNGAGAAPNITVQIATPDAASFRRSEAYITGQIARAVARGQRSL